MKSIIKIFKCIYELFTRPAAKIGLGILVTGGFIAGAFFWQAFNTGLEVTNKEEFCLSCHTMKDHLLPELQKTVHWQNRSGVRARCPDCHVPHDNFTDKIARKMQASREVLSHLTGQISDKNKFEEHRLVLAQREWARFKANNSKECRNCHDYNSMDISKMRITSQVAMRGAAERNASCVDCHKGIAHSLPDTKGSRSPALDALMSEASSQTTNAGKLYYNVLSQELFADEALTQKLGSIEIATPVKLLEIKGNVQKVELDLWRKNKGYGRVLNSHFGLNISSAVLTKEVAQNKDIVKVLESKVDELTGLEWQKVAVQAWIKKDSILENPESMWSVARSNYQTSCSVCHRQPVESGHDANQWSGLFSGMVGFTSMDNDTAKLVLKYLQMHSSDFAKGKQQASPEDVANQKSHN